MSQEPIAAELVADNVRHRFFFVAYRYSNAELASTAQRIADSSPWQELSSFRLLEANSGSWFVAVLSEQRQAVAGVSQLISEWGEPMILEEDLVLKLIMRRIRQVAEHGNHRGHYAPEGRELDHHGHAHRPKRRPRKKTKRRKKK